ncbi:MAG: hypothetical protein ACOYOU_16380, partial [Kiritimatiellia bacterium]
MCGINRGRGGLRLRGRIDRTDTYENPRESRNDVDSRCTSDHLRGNKLFAGLCSDDFIVTFGMVFWGTQMSTYRLETELKQMKV